MKEIVITSKQAGLRVDRVLAEILPELGSRGRRRLLENALLNGKPVKKTAAKVASGDVLRFGSSGEGGNSSSFIGMAYPYFYIFKPRGLHTAALSGSYAASVEAELPAILNWPGAEPGILLQRLDYNTCGIITGSFTESGAVQFRNAERQGNCFKLYLALLSGKPERSFIAVSAIDMRNRKKSKILPCKADQDRWTWFWPLPTLPTPAPDCCWAMCMIKRGARHQIRAHAAEAGFALVGDELYGGKAGSFCLRHFYINCGEFACFDVNDWPGAFLLPAGAGKLLRDKVGELDQDFGRVEQDQWRNFSIWHKKGGYTP